MKQHTTRRPSPVRPSRLGEHARSTSRHLLVVALVAGLTACGGDDDDPSTDGATDGHTTIEDASAQDGAKQDGAVADASSGDAGSIKDAGKDATTMMDATAVMDATAMMDATTVMDAAVGTGEPTGLTGITAKHNAARAAVSPVPSVAIPAMTWSTTVATAAQTWADHCTWEHGGAAGYGQNLYATTSGASAQGVINSWVGEATNYNYAANTCAANKVCGHYTQVVWRSSTQLGCGIATCPESTSPFYPDFKGTWQLVVCDYSPPGNNGNRPY